MGINMPEVEIKEAKGVKYLLVKRYDRNVDKGLIKRIHQEDFCQATGVAPAFKYQADGGVSIKDCFNLTDKMSYPIKDRLKLLEMVIYNFLIGNSDAHGKNFSILHHQNGKTELAPMYDVLCGFIYNEDKTADKFATKYGGEYKNNRINIRQFEKMCDEVNISFTQTKKIVAEYTNKLPSVINKVIEQMKSEDHNIKTPNKILEFTKKQCEKLNVALLLFYTLHAIILPCLII